MGRSDYWTDGADQVVVSDERVRNHCADRPLICVRGESGPELRGTVRTAVLPLTCKESYQGYRLKYDSVTISAHAVTFVLRLVSYCRLMMKSAAVLPL